MFLWYLQHCSKFILENSLQHTLTVPGCLRTFSLCQAKEEDMMWECSAGQDGDPRRVAYGNGACAGSESCLLWTVPSHLGEGQENWPEILDNDSMPLLKVSQLASWGTNFNSTTASACQQASWRRHPVFPVQRETGPWLTDSQARVTKALKLRSLQAGGRQWSLCLLSSA